MSLDARYWDREFETRPWAWIESWQAQQLGAWLETLPQRSELYRDLLAAAGRRVGLRGYWVTRGRLPTLDMLEHLPFTTPERLLEGQCSGPSGRPLGPQQAVPQEYIVQVVASALDDGRSVLSGLTRRDQELWTDTAAGAFWTAGLRPDDIVAHLAGSPAVGAGWPAADGLRRLGATVAWLNGCSPEQVLEQLPLLQVTAIVATTQFALDLAERAVAGPPARAVAVRTLVTGGEPGSGRQELRGLAAQAWGVGRVRETMGLADVMACMWAECEAADGLHFSAAKHVIVELVDPETGARLDWDEGVMGQAVYTTFDRDATPVLRYRSADLLEVTGRRCVCGRTSPRVRWAGHAGDLLVCRAATVFPSTIREVVLRRFGDLLEPHLRIWKETAGQVRVDEPIPVELEAAAGITEERGRALAEQIREAVRDELRVGVAPVLLPPGTLPREAHGAALVQVRPAAHPNGEDRPG